MALIKTIAELKTYLNIDANAKIASMQPYIDQAEQLYIIPAIGQVFYDEVNTQYNAASLNADNTTLLPYLQRAIAYYAMFLSVNQMTVNFGERGVREFNNPESNSAPRWKEEKLERACLINGDRFTDKLLDYLETNATGSKYANWFNSAFNTKKSGQIVYSTTIASKYIQINDSRRIFLKLKPAIKDVEATIVAKYMGLNQYNDLVTKLTNNTMDANSTALAQKCEPIIAKMALYLMIPFLKVTIADTGIFLHSSVDLLRDSSFLASENDISYIMKGLKDGVFGYESDISLLKQFLIDNVANYPLYQAANAYTGRPSPGPSFLPLDNSDPKQTYFNV